jgi:hypothetical protein
MADVDRHRVILAPYLPLRHAVEVAEWWIGPIAIFPGPWADPRAEAMTRGLAAAFQDARGQPLAAPTLVVPQGDQDPPLAAVFALQKALDLTVLDGNPPFDAPHNSGWTTATSDNSLLIVWPIDLASGGLTLSAGLMVHAMDGGWRIGDDNVVVRAPIELHLPWDRYLDRELLEAAYLVFSGRHTGDTAFARRLELGVTWLSQAWRNTESLRWSDRVIMLKTGFEAVSGRSSASDTAAWLEDRFNRLRTAGVTDFLASHLLWSPGETATRTWVWKRGTPQKCTDLTHWFYSFASARNEIIHEGQAASLDYQVAGSRYCGNMVFVGERLLRETVRVCLGDFGYPDLWKQAAVRALAKVFGAGPTLL